jgi:mono/diheme cytochrome c family protein
MNLKIKNSKFIVLIFVIVIMMSLIFGGCQGRPSEETPIHINPNMDMQPKILPQSSSEFFENGSGMRLPVEGTIARGDLNENLVYWEGKDPYTGEFVSKSPIVPTIDNLEYGRERFNIYCSICHGQVGDGTGIIIKKGYMVPPSFHTDQIREYPDGQIFDIITNGIRNMPRYSDQIPVEDRWYIVNYLRALQRSQNASYSDLPDDIKEKIK